MYQYNLGLRFQMVATDRSEQTAIWFSEQHQVGYGELNRLSNQFARWLLDRGIAKGDVVCLSGAKSPSTFACIIACLKIGAIYCVLEPISPIERLRKILCTCAPSLLVADQDLIQKAEAISLECETVSVDTQSDSLMQLVSEFDWGNLPETHLLTGEDAAYIMFTSGSTGVPKGAVMTHANVLNLVEWAKDTYSISPEDVFTNLNPLHFDNSVFDLYSTLFNGARLVPFSLEEVRNPKALVDKIAAAGCTSWFSVPSLLIFLQTMKAADGKNLRSIRRFIFGGEGYPKAKLKQLYDCYANTSEFFNVYGPTECTCICSSYKVTERDFYDFQGLPPLGHLAGNFSCLILDEDGQLMKAGEIGELCLLGANVGKGYYNDPERTGVGFVQNPFNDKFREVMYRTGDLVRLDPTDGKLYIHGRRDNQIKHMGYRVELEEVEAALHCLSYVSEAVALHADLNGLSRILGIVVPVEEFEDNRIRHDLERIVPAYMVPSIFYREQVLPKNPNGKIDRRYLKEKYIKPMEQREARSE